jgi:glucose 1-dehydrogenase
MDLSGQIALVTGAGSGIGRATAARLAKAGARVVLNDLGNDGGAEALAARLPGALAIRADVSRRDEVEAMMARVEAEMGGLDVLVNDAGIASGAAFLDLADDVWQRVLAVNLTGPFLCSQTAARLMVRRGGGAIVNVSSIHEDVPLPDGSAYAAAKGGLRMLMRNLAFELGPHRIRINNVAPGPIRTGLTRDLQHSPERMALLREVVPAGRMADPEEVAEVICFLASAGASYVSGSTYYVDGGMACHTHPV